MLSRSCYWYNEEGSNPEEEIQTFIDILGKDWEISRICGGLSSSLSFLFFCYLLSFTCSSQTRGVRYFNTVFLCVVLTTLQGLTFYTFDSNNDFCEEYICTFSRSAGFSVVSMGCFFLSGLCFCCTQDYPGPRWNKKKTSSFSSSSPLKARQQQIAPDSRAVLAPGVTTKSKVATAMGEESKKEEVGYRNFGGNPDDGLRTNNESNNVSSGAPAYYTTGAYMNDGSDGSGSGNHENVTRSIDEFNNNSFEEIEEEVVEDKYEEGLVATGGTFVADRVRQINNDDFNTLVGLKAGDSREVVTEVTNDEVKIVEDITHADGTKTVTKTTEEIAEDGYQREGEIKIDDDFVAHPGLGAGDDCEVITEVTEDEIKVVETIRHADGSQTVTETHEEIPDEKVWV